MPKIRKPDPSDPTSTPPTPPRLRAVPDLLAQAQALDALGFNVIPSGASKRPGVKWKDYQRIRTGDRLLDWFSQQDWPYLGIVTGQISGIVVLDCDTPEAVALWRDRLGSTLDSTVSVATRKGMHFYFRHPGAGTEIRNVQNPDEGWDLRGDGGYVEAPGGTSDKRWVRGPQGHILDLPEVLREAGRRPSRGSVGSSERPMSPMSVSETYRNIRNLPRNPALARMAGHYAQMYRDQSQRDMYDSALLAINLMFDPPLDEAEVIKVADSIWQAEQSNHPGRGITPSRDNGWLTGVADGIATLCKKDDETYQDQWADFDLTCRGVADGDDRYYDVTLYPARRAADPVEGILTGAILADSKRLATWLAAYGVSVLPPNGEIHRGSAGARLARYLESQGAPRFEVVPCLGWHEPGFICHEGLITETGLHPFGRVRPNPMLRQRARFRYGFGSCAQARDVLRQVLTFHDQTVAAVFGAWWAATLVKPVVKRHLALFPTMALQAASESGKTTGMFAMLMQLAGKTEGQALATRAAMTRAMGDHNSGIYWIDDANNLDHLDEILRAVTGDGFIRKMDTDRNQVVVEELVAPVLLSGETLGNVDQKALADRWILLDVPNPSGRQSLTDPSRSQWDDIRALRDQYDNDLTCLAGNMVQMAYQSAIARYDGWAATATSGFRAAHKHRALVWGSDLLVDLTGEPVWGDLVRGWVDLQEDRFPAMNSLVDKILPQSLAILGWPTSAYGVPVYVKNDRVHFHPIRLAAWWFKQRNGRVSERTETAEAIGQQRRVLGDRVTKTSDRESPGRAAKMIQVYRLDEQLSRLVVEKSESGA